LFLTEPSSFVSKAALVFCKRYPKSKPFIKMCPNNSVVDPDPYVFGLTGSGSVSISQKYRSGSFYQAKIVRITLIPTVLWLLFDFLSLKNDVNVPSKSIKQKNFFKKNFFVGPMTKIAGSGYESGFISQRHGSADSDLDPDLHQNVMDLQHRPKMSPLNSE
jgi:hypothetical protein